jgi:hypothetical protein
MTIKLGDYLGKLSEEGRQAIEKRAAELLAEEARPRQLREALDPERGPRG